MPKRYRPVSPAEKAGTGAFLLAGLLLPFDLHLTTIPLTAFLILCMAAPFFPGFNFFLPVISRGGRDSDAVALTFDDGPDPVSTPELLRLLARHRVSATFFVTGRKAEQYPDLIREMLDRGHTIGNHTCTHDNLVMLKREAVLMREIASTQDVLKSFGIVPLAFRPPVGIVSPRLAPVLQECGMYALNFSRRGGDFGNRRLRHLSRRLVRRVRSGDIVALHDVRPVYQDVRVWLLEVERLLDGIRRKGLKIIPLAELIGQPVCLLRPPFSPSSLPHPAPGAPFLPSRPGKPVSEETP